jgi:hypothetical protein
MVSSDEKLETEDSYPEIFHKFDHFQVFFRKDGLGSSE